MTNRIKKSTICQHIGNYILNTDLINTYIPKAGDVGIFKVIELGKHTRLQLVDGKNHHIYPDDVVMAVFGTRYATSQLEGYVPTEPCQEYHVLGQGGVMGIMHSIHVKYELKGPTTLSLIGYATNENGDVLNTKYYQEKVTPFNNQKPTNAKIILSIGGSMDSGKTTTAGFLCKGIHNANKKVSFIKLTGTVYNKDTVFVYDCGADTATDFSYFGFPSTYMCEENELMDLYQSLLNMVALQNPDYIVIEIADGLLQRETKMLLSSEAFMNTVDEVIYSDGNSTGALSGLQILDSLNIKPFAICGSFTASPLLVKEVQAVTNIPVLTLDDLMVPSIIAYIKNLIRTTTASNTPNNSKVEKLPPLSHAV